MDFRGISSQLMLMGTFPNEYKPVFQAFGHDYDPYSLATIGPFKADDNFPTQIKPVTRPDIEYVIPAGKVVTVKSIDKSADITIGGASEKIPVYGAGRESTMTRTYPSDTVADKDSWRGTDTIMGEIVPCAGWYNKGDDGGGGSYDPITGWDYGYGLSSDVYTIYDATNAASLDYYVPATLPIGIVIEPVRKWNNRTHLNYVDTPVYSVWRNGRLVLPYVNMRGVIDTLGITLASDDIYKYLHGYVKNISSDSNALAIARAFAKVSGLSTFVWGTHRPLESVWQYDYNGFDKYGLIKPDVFGNYTTATLFDMESGSIYNDDDNPLNEHFRRLLVVGHVNYYETVYPRDLMQYVDTDPRILIGTSAGGIEPFLAYFIHDFMVIMGEETSVDVSEYIKADGIANLVSDGVFGVVDISLVFRY